jgi:hypothetical protein
MLCARPKRPPARTDPHPAPANNNVHKSQKGAVEEEEEEKEEKEAVDAYASGLSPRKPRSGHARRPPKERLKKLQAQR